jgi:hypothetical protein
VSIYSEATIKGAMRPVELVPPVPGRTSTGPADIVAAVEVRPSEGTELGQYLTIQNGAARSQLQVADGSRGWAVGPIASPITTARRSSRLAQRWLPSRGGAKT